MSRGKMFLRKFLRNWRLLFCIIVPLLLLPILFIDDGTGSKKFRCLYVILLMGTFWMFEAMPLAVTALFPVALFPFLGIQSTSQIVPNYMRETGMMFIGGISLALGIERSGLHKRIALNMMILIGSSPWRILLGIMVTTMFLSCWIVGNTAVTAMMIPIVSGLVDTLEESNMREVETKKKLRILYMLAVGYAANIGGTAVMIGSIPNIIFKDLIALEGIGQGGKYREINFANWIAYNMPIAIINLIIVWLYLGFLYLRKDSNQTNLKCFKPAKNSLKADQKVQLNNSQTELELENTISNSTIDGQNVKMDFDNVDPDFETEIDLQAQSAKTISKTLRLKLTEMGGMTFHEQATSVLFALAIILWFTRDPQIFKGWNDFAFPDGKIAVGDSTVAVIIVILMFTIPKDFGWLRDDWDSSIRQETMMTWSYIQKHFPWNVILLVGGGFAMSDGAEKSGLSLWFGDQLNGLEDLNKPLMLLIILVVISCFTEIMSNSATITLLTPILIALSKRLQVHPLYISFAGAIACQYSFILPTSNPPNAIVFTAGNMQILDMVKPGILLNFACLSVLFLMNISWGEFIFNFSEYSYAPISNSSSRVYL